MTNQKQMLANYANSAADLAELVKHDIQHGGYITNNTVLALNKFIISANAMNDLIEEIRKDQILLN